MFLKYFHYSPCKFVLWQNNRDSNLHKSTCLHIPYYPHYVLSSINGGKNFTYIIPHLLSADSSLSTMLCLFWWKNTNVEPFLYCCHTWEQTEHSLSPLPLQIQRPPPSLAKKKSISGYYSKNFKPYLNNLYPALLSQRSWNYDLLKLWFAPELDFENGIIVKNNGIAYKIKDAPFEFQKSYIETYMWSFWIKVSVLLAIWAWHDAATENRKEAIVEE